MARVKTAVITRKNIKNIKKSKRILWCKTI